MKETEISSIIGKINELLLSCNTLLCNSGIMKNTEKTYGFNLLPVESDKFQSGFYYAVRYKDPETKKWLPTKKSTLTDNKELAKVFAIENREAIIKEYKEQKEKRKTKNDGKDFYQMLNDYYQLGSEYLRIDTANNRREISKEDCKKFNSFINNYLIPYLRQNNINGIQEITNGVYSEFKLYLQGKNISTKTINNYLTALTRILQYHERNGQIEKLPFARGAGHIRISNEEKAKSKQAEMLPIEYLKGIFSHLVYADGEKREEVLFSHLLAMFGLTTGMRDSEVARIKREDIMYIKSEDTYIVKTYNHKTAYFHREATDEYRKTPLHPFVVSLLKSYIQIVEQKRKIEQTDYLFGVPKTDEKGRTDGHLHSRKIRKAIIQLYRIIKARQIANETGKLEDTFISDEELDKEMKEERIVFYSLRHTFNTLFVLHRHNDTNTDRTDDLIDYFMGHKISNAMRANYSHINKVDNKTFINTYGKSVIEMLDTYIFETNDAKQRRSEVVKKFVKSKYDENQHLLKDGKMASEDFIDKVITPLFAKEKTDTTNDDEFFTTI